ncbi:DNRLRE domain-containing protein [Streptomyces sp. NPDC058877]|uniref:DNRLRE domain-containing protein n=1 Tax=Streptomyces sp. NPDC058877 TaxID=3346665 RepID=UPI0036A47397
MRQRTTAQRERHPLPSPGRLRRIALATALVMTFGLMEGIAVAEPPAAPVQEPQVQGPAEAEDAASALLMARLQNRRIEVTGERTETTTSWANPDGSMSLDSYTGPFRFRDDNGAWRKVDPELVESTTGEVHAAAHPLDLTLAGQSSAEEVARIEKSGGEPGEKTTPAMPLVSLDSGEGHEMTLSWRGALPDPTVHGTEARYANVSTGTDMVIESTRTGFEQFLELKDRSAVDSNGSVTMTLQAKGLKVRANTDRSVSFLEPGTGKETGVLPAPVMWDATVDPNTGEHENKAGVGLKVTQNGDTVDLTLTPDAAFLADPATKFPVTVDPAVNLGASFDTFVEQGYTTDQSAATELKLGNNGSGQVARSFLAFPMSKITGKVIKSASLNLWNFHSWSCNARSWEVWDTSSASTSTRWTAQPHWNNKWATSTATKGYSSTCADGWVSTGITSLVAAWVANGNGTNTLGIRATDETDAYAWKRFNSGNAASNTPYVSVTYNTKPGAATPLSPLTGAATNDTTPTLSGKATDADGNTVRLTFEVWKSDGTAALQSGTSTYVASGATATWTPGTALAPGSYKWRAAVYDGQDWNGTWSAWQTFTVDTTAPGAPFVSSTTYPQDGAWHGSGGTPGSFTFTPASGTTDLAGYVYSLDGAAPVTVSATSTTTVSITPSADGHRTLKVQAKDKAGNVSTAVFYDFLVGQGAMVRPAEGAVSARRVQIAVDAQPKYTRVTYQWRRGPGASVYDVPLANLTKQDNTPITSVKARLSEVGEYANWSVLETLGQIGGVVQVRAMLYTDNDADAPYISEWRGFTVDPNADGAASDDVGPGSVNLLTGDYSVSVTDADEFGMSSSRSASSRGTDRGWMPQGQRLTANQQDVSTDTTGFSATTATVTRDTALGQDGSTDSLKVVPTTNTSGDSFAMVGGDQTALRLGMKPGKTYRFSAWAYVPASTGLSPQHARGLRLYAGFNTPGGFVEPTSRKVPYTDAWAELTLDFTVPADATTAFLRLYNGFGANSGKAVYFDHLSLRELVAPFGPQWAGGAAGGATDNELNSLTFPGKDVAVITGYDDSTITFAKSSDGSFSPEPGSEGVVLAASGSDYVLTGDDGTLTRFKKQTGSDVYVVDSVSGTDAASTSRYVYDTTDGRTLVKRVIGEAEPGVDDTGQCTGSVPARGCEVLEYVYATATTVTATTPGDFTDRVKAVRIWSWDPGAGAETAVDVASYRYDSLGRLAEAWDPRKGSADDTAVFKTVYSYDSGNRLSKIDTAGELPWYFDYGPAGADQDPGRLLQVRRPALKPGSKDVVEGETASTVVYEVPLTRGAGGPYDLDGASAAKWGQADVPTDATAVFDVESTPATNTATATTPGPDGYQQATVHYLNASAAEVNTATWSPTGVGDIDTAEFDRFGNTVRTLDATGRLLALGLGENVDEKVIELELPDDSAARAGLLDGRSVYSRDGQDLLEETGPVFRALLDEAVPTQADPPMPALAAGTSVVVREHNVHKYDEGKPDGAAYHLETTSLDGARIEGYADDVEVRVTKTGYDTPIGGTSGWTLRTETSVTTDAVAGGANLTALIKYDAAGRAVESRRPGSNGADTGTVKTVFYTAGANPDDAACGNRPEWAGNPCVTLPGGAVTGADTAHMPDTLPVKRITRYSRHGDIEETTETNAGKTRTSTTVYDDADRIVSTKITGDLGQDLPEVTTEYDPVAGNAVKTTAGGKTITRTFDALDRLLSYTDADGGTTTTEFDTFGKPVKVSDNTGTTTYTYDRTQEPRGMVTSVTDSVAGTFTAKYGPDGQLTEQTYPGGYVRKDTFNASGAATGRTYTRVSDGAVVYGQHLDMTTQGAVAADTNSTDSKEYTYDRLGRLTWAAQTTTDGCTTRAYAFDEAGRSIAGRMNRTSKTVYAPAEDGSCTTANGTVTASSYDSADRLLTAGYTYDAFGRTTATGTGSVNTYWDNDLVASQTKGDKRQSWSLDPAHRFTAFTTEAKQPDGTWANATSKLNHYGDDSDEPRWIIEDTTQGTLTRNVSGPDGDLTATTSATGDTELQFANLHGDVAVTLDTATTTPKVLTFDEFGVPAEGQATQRYGWLGAKQRSSEALDDVILMGARLYAPALGRFLQVDPQPGGNANPYDYCAGDPVNCTDLDGNWGFSFKKMFKRVARVAEVASYIPGPIGNIASAVGAISYAATGNWRKAAEMSVGIAFGSAGRVAVKAFKAVRAIRKAGRINRWASRARRASRCNSFAPDTPVLMADGSYLPIGAIQIGDQVLATDPVTGDTTAQPVLDVIAGYGTKHLVEIDTDLDTSNGSLLATADHPLWVIGRGWIPASRITVGDLLLSPTGEGTPVRMVQDLGEIDNQSVFNLNVGNVHTFVINDGNVDEVAHNSNACPIVRVQGRPGGGIVSPGPYARYGVSWPKGVSRSFRSIRSKINMLGNKYGCHRCGTKKPGTRSGNWIPDHWPAVSINLRWGGKLKTVLLPHCNACSTLQRDKLRLLSLAIRRRRR